MRIGLSKLFAVILLGTTLTATACATADDVDDLGPADGGDGKADGTPTVKWDARIKNIVPKNVHNYLEKYQWGDYHIMFHMTRRWYVIGTAGRSWLKRVGQAAADVQEGDPGNGLEFLAMHRAMIQHLRTRWGSEPVKNNEDGRKTFGAVLDGWKTDDDVIAHLEKVGGDVEGFKAMAAKINDFASFASEDEFGLFLETSFRLVSATARTHKYRNDTTVGAGTHNWLHGQFTDPASPIDVGNPQTNLSNMRFWGIHGWIEAKWQAFEQFHQRTGPESAQYQAQLTRFLQHMQLHSDMLGATRSPHVTSHPSRALAQTLAPFLFDNGADCDNLEAGTEMDGCTP